MNKQTNKNTYKSASVNWIISPTPSLTCINGTSCFCDPESAVNALSLYRTPRSHTSPKGQHSATQRSVGFSFGAISALFEEVTGRWWVPFFFCCCCSRQRPHTLCTSVNVSVHKKKKYGNFVVNLQVFSSYSYVLRRDYLMIKNKLRNEPTQSHKNKITQYRNINQNHNVLSFLLESLFTTVF